MNEEYVHWLAHAKELALHAGQMIKKARQEAGFQRDYKAGHELVTTTDLAVDLFICEQIRRRFPSHEILSEESSPTMAWQDTAEQTPVWVIDPIDGTVNFAHGHAHVAVSIGIYLAGQRVVGVVYAPFLDECYTAIKGQGAFCNDKVIQVTNNTVLRHALVATGFPYVKDGLPSLLEKVSKILQNCQDIRRAGSAALDLCWVASGRLDAYFESVKPWDMAAGTLIAEEAGATVGHYGESSQRWPDVVNGDSLLVATPHLFAQIKNLVQENESN
ncbi:inositol monophosphatase family protein [Marinomonas epiphytica]